MLRVIQVFRCLASSLAWVVLLCAVLAAAPGAGRAQISNSGAAMQPVVVELFTSQGCSSCPPADALLGELAARGDVIALSLHVDYWDYIGWKDPYGNPRNTERQRAYAGELGLRYIYTPQMVIDGRENIIGSHRDEILASLEVAAERRKPVAVDFIPGNGGTVVISEGHAPDRGATIWLAIFDESHDTQVKRGENEGRTIHNVNVVRRLERLGTWMGKRLEIPLNLDGAAARGSFGCAVLVQQGRHGPVMGAGLMRLDSLTQ